MMVQDQEEVGESSKLPTGPHHIPTIIQPSTSQPQKKQRSRRSKRKDTEELMALCSTLQSRVLALETTKTTQATEIASLKKRVKKLERRKKSRTQGLKRLNKGRISDIDDDAGITLVSTHFDADIDIFGIHDLDGDEVVVESDARAGEKRYIKEVVDVIDTASTILVSVATTTTTTTVITDDEITLAKALAELKSAKPPTQAASTRPKVKGIVIHEQEQAPTPTVSSQQTSQVKVQDKGKGKMVEPEPVKKMSKKYLVKLDEELVFKLQAEEEEEEERLLAQILQAQEQDELTDEEKARLFIQFLEKRRKHFTAKRAKEKRNRPPTRSQQRSIMCTYLKNMEGWKHKKESSKKAEAEIAHESSLKRTGEELEQESSKKQKLEEDKESEELKKCLEIVPDYGDDGKKGYYQIIRADGSSKMYLVFSHMLKSFDKEDLETLYKLVKAKYGSTRPVEDLDLVLYGDLKTMFEPHVVDNVWKNQLDYRVLDWKLYDSCGVYSLSKENVHIHMLVEKRFPLTAPTITNMLNRKLQADHWNEICYQLLKLLTKQLKN
ncbi:hypothetical protein Tco_1414616 [Tanacetum coccineum]